ncbi:SusC/RagA family TonB-linked outer membrane protein [Mucilaginibacter auburnensis]|uniref:TonB-linked SusC/RagA family outer membrane protein n=1 Tax=Mucilaginibacter auburnensis TaxID=1457233 RepID=A0A2H9VW87_9SPHI|nr:SusC/RagA family TonB-linked outer membrane protein [Mucilaginibacter auburnensis]PJJ85076.1 TonB-linked SusC/RagA family outer membrane protein [Mucilaginibacter auburnensis]
MRNTFTKLTRCLLLFLCLGCCYNAYAQNGNSRISLTDAIKSVQTRFKTQLAYEHGLLDNKFTTANDLKGSQAEEALKNILYPNNLIFLYVSENNYTIVARNASFFNSGTPAVSVTVNKTGGVATHTVRGNITGDNGEPLPFVNVWVKGTNQATRSDDDGGFLLPAVNSTDVISFSMMGYETRELVAGNDIKLNVSLRANQTMLNEVSIVSNGYQTISKERATGAAFSLSAKEIEEHPQNNIIQRLEGLTPGMQINLSSGDRGFFYQSGGSIATVQGANSTTRTVGTNDYGVTIRGKNTLQGEQSPLVVLDGAITELDMSTLNPSDIENITVLKDAAAASIWGVRAGNGVIVITTKKGKRNSKPTVNFNTLLTFGEKPDLGYFRTMTSAQQLAYEKELADRSLLPAPNPSNYFNALSYYSPGTNLAFALKAGTITQAQYAAQASALSAIDNRDQISKYLLQGAKSQQYNLSINGGSENNTYFYSLSYSKESPYEVRNYGSRLTATMNNSWKLFNWATLSTSFKGSFFNLVNNGISLNTLYNPTQSTLMPYQQLADANGNGIYFDRLNPAFTSTLSSVYKDWRYNYLDELALGDNTQKTSNYAFNVNLKVPLFEGLSASALYTTERSFNFNRQFYDPATFYMRDALNYYTYPTATGNSLNITNGGALQQSNTNQNNYSLRGQLDFDRTFNKRHQLTAIAGTEIRETNIGQNTSTLWGYNMATGITNTNINFNTSSPTYAYIAGLSPTAYTTFNKGGYPTQVDKQRRFLSYYSNAAYTLDNKYILSASVRYDDYNNFGLDRKYRATPLWSAGAKWHISRENFLKDVKWIDQLAIRATYGVNGNLSLNTYPFTYISLGSNDGVTGQSSANIIALANPQLRWEKTIVKNLGIDFSLFKSRLNGSFEVFDKNGKDLVYSFPISSVYQGNISPQLTRNAATLTGWGVEASLNGVIVRKTDFSWSAGLSFAYNTNKITDGRFNEAAYASNLGTSPSSISYISGYPSDKLFVYRNAGLDASGMTQIYDRNGDIVKSSTVTLTSLSDLKYAGRTTAPYFGGFNTNVRYKQFSLFAQFSYQFGNVFLKPSIQNYISSSTTLRYDLSADIAKRWMQPGDEANTVVPGLAGGSATQISLIRYQNSDINVLKGDYIRMRQLTFAYQIPNAVLNRFKIRGAQVGITANNLGLIWRANKEGYDPDFANYVGSLRGLPAARSYTLNLNLNF